MTASLRYRPDPTTGVEEATRRRIRDAAIERIARSGMTVGLRAIAADAGVSAPLLVHHFGSKDGLLSSCDERAWDRLDDHRYTPELGASARLGVLQRMSEVPELAPVTLYVLRRIQGGGPSGAAFLEHVVDNAYAAVEAGVQRGVFKPSADPRGRARWLAVSSVGAMVVQLTLAGVIDDDADLAVVSERFTAVSSFASLEVFSQGLLVDDSRFTGYLDALRSTDSASRPNQYWHSSVQN